MRERGGQGSPRATGRGLRGWRSRVPWQVPARGPRSPWGAGISAALAPVRTTGAQAAPRAEGPARAQHRLREGPGLTSAGLAPRLQRGAPPPPPPAPARCPRYLPPPLPSPSGLLCGQPCSAATHPAIGPLPPANKRRAHWLFPPLPPLVLPLRPARHRGWEPGTRLRERRLQLRRNGAGPQRRLGATGSGAGKAPGTYAPGSVPCRSQSQRATSAPGAGAPGLSRVTERPDMGHGHEHGHGKMELPDYKQWKIEGTPLQDVQERLAKRGLRDPWLRNEAWRYMGGFAKPVTVMDVLTKGFKWGFVAFVVALGIEYTLFPPKKNGGHH
ncbi:NADH dehydrogenase [ubiquinone] 1 beta subcomplex subunit 3 isoform X1 [Dermochelys coriacea]|uniref:NADH dehydrogenase [ubiquinone] 1 beta subcomplex subunit 3 isoform X1 n=1 Tax=Dermochelys coriacea TaxID=27794 RepID=UPI001CA996BD|nr:NADH dehydrogenase [ubiquinone] 1 beta subcomplex subunit 3 isoform X1 [Dermochelys coriacea]